MDIDICISRAIYSSLRQYGVERIADWTLRTARTRMRLARSAVHSVADHGEFHLLHSRATKKQPHQ